MAFGLFSLRGWSERVKRGEEGKEEILMRKG